jgi:integrase
MAIRVQVRKQPDRKNFTLYYDDDAGGREVTRSAGTADFAEAQRAAERWEQELGVFRGDVGWAYFKARFLQEGCSTVSPRSKSAAFTALDHFERLVPVESITEVTSDHLSTFRDRLLGRDLEISTVNKQLRHLKIALRWAVRLKMLAELPHVPLSKGGNRKFMRGRPVTEAELKKLLKAAGAATGEADASTWRRVLELLWWSGLRIEELTDFSWDTPPVLVQLDAQPYPQVLFYVEGHKARRDEAWVCPPDLAAWLAKTPARKRSGLVAPIPFTTGDVRAKASAAVARIGRAAGVVVDTIDGEPRYASAHDLRRSFGTRWALQVPPVVLQRLMRHKSIETTMKYYVGLDVSQYGALLWREQPARRVKR